MTPQFVVFDLDGTLIDGYAAIADALSYAMRSLGREELALESVRGMVGHGLERLVERAVGPDLVPEGVRLFRERYPQIAVEKTDLMPGVPEVLAELERRGHVLAVASNKPARFSRLILEAKGVGDRFLVISGPDEVTPPKPDPAMLRAMMGLARASPAETLVVGDMEIDAEMARAAGCRVVLVPSGSRTRDELAEVPADALLANLTELPDWI
ncbi:MAG: HAD-IA family hydrolase, partial [Thermoanaerobaculia bacterium]|nr:HAD-IA family hydrolase [Thermoanaerobaculia bacterium]